MTSDPRTRKAFAKQLNAETLLPDEQAAMRDYFGIETDNLITDATTARTLSATDARKYITATNATGLTITVLTDSVVPIPAGTEFYYRRATAAGPFALSNSGVTINGAANIAAVAADGNFALKKKAAANEWDLI